MSEHTANERGKSLAHISGASALQVIDALKDQSLSIGEPFSAPLLLVEDTRVAAVERTPGAAKAAQEILVGDELSFIRQPEHADSCWAIRVTNRQGNVVGYVARDVEEILARLMDGGKRVYGKVTDVSLHGQHTNVRMEVYLDD